MKHVIVIETPDRAPLSERLENQINSTIEDLIDVECFIQSTFNQHSAIAAVHEMYNAPEWKGGI